MNRPTSQKPRQTMDAEIMVIGAGVAGALTALKLAKEGYQVVLIDRNKEALGEDSASFRNSYRGHVGPHYLGSEETALECLERIIEFKRDHPTWISSEQLIGLHYVLQQKLQDEGQIPVSAVSPKQARKVCELIVEKYEQLIAADPDNKVLGEPGELFKYFEDDSDADAKKSVVSTPIINPSIPVQVEKPFLFADLEAMQESWDKPEIYQTKFNEQQSDTVDAEVGLTIVAQEPQIDIHAARQDLNKKLEEQVQAGKIIFLKEHEATEITQCMDENQTPYYELTVKSADSDKKIIKSPLVVNCTWQNIEEFDRQLGILEARQSLVRVKATVVVELPEELRDIPTWMAGIGPYCSCSNLKQNPKTGKWQALLTAEPFINIDQYAPGFDKVPQNTIDLLDSPERRIELAKQVRAFCAKFNSQLSQTKINEETIMEDVRISHVRVVSMEKEKIHGREAIKLSFPATRLGYLRHPATKMIFAPASSKEAVRLIAKEAEVLKCFPAMYTLVKKALATIYLSGKEASDKKALKEKYESDKAMLKDEYVSDEEATSEKYTSDKKALENKYASDKKALKENYRSSKKALKEIYPSDKEALEEKHPSDKKTLEEKYLSDKKTFNKGLSADKRALLEEELSSFMTQTKLAERIQSGLREVLSRQTLDKGAVAQQIAEHAYNRFIHDSQLQAELEATKIRSISCIANEEKQDSIIKRSLTSSSIATNGQTMFKRSTQPTDQYDKLTERCNHSDLFNPEQKEKIAQALKRLKEEVATIDPIGSFRSWGTTLEEIRKTTTLIHDQQTIKNALYQLACAESSLKPTQNADTLPSLQ